jgi:hypothetical protein
MRLRTALGVAAVDLYHQSWRLVVLNVFLGAVLLGVVLAAVTVRAAVVLAVLLGPATAAVMHCAVTLAQTEDLRLREAVVGLRRLWRRGLVLGLVVAVAAGLGVVAVPFYGHAGVWAWPFAALTLYVLLVFFLFQLALWPLAAYEPARPLRDVMREAAFVVGRRPLGFAGLALALVLVNALGVAAAVIPFLTLTLAYSFLVAAHFALPKNPAREV